MPWVFVLLWSTGFIVARYGMPHAPPFGFLALRYALSVACLFVWIALARVRWPTSRAQWGHLAVTGVLMHAGYLGGVWAAVKAGIGAGTVSLIVGLQPVLTALWLSASAARRHHEPVAPRQWAGLGLGLLGLTLVVWEKLGIGEVTPLNLALAIFALVSITAGTLYQKARVAPCDVRSASAIQLIAAFVVTLPLALLEREPMDWHPQMVGALTWSVIALTLGASSLLYLMLQRGAATRVASLMYLVPPCTALLAWLLFAEPYSIAMGLGMTLTVAGVWLVVRSTEVIGARRSA
ncbi:MAG: DMT family transporter [Burkholderiaceae bacterium]